MKKSLIAATGLLLAMPTCALDITVSVSQLQSDKGALVVQVYDSDDTWLSDQTVLSKRQALESGDAAKEAVTIPIQLEAGRYALSVYHDENNNEELDANFIGIPKEPVGLSNDHRPKFGPPRYKKAEIELSEDQKVLIELQ